MGYLSDIVRCLNDTQEVIFVGTGVILIDNKDRILIASRTDNDEWCIPGGSLEVGESLTHCAIRETFEETGIVVEEKNINLNTVAVVPEPIIKNGRKIHIVSVSYWVTKYNDIDFNIDSREFTKYGWLTKSEIGKLNKITPYTKIALEYYWRVQHDRQK